MGGLGWGGGLTIMERGGKSKGSGLEKVWWCLCEFGESGEWVACNESPEDRKEIIGRGADGSGS